jgi:hypothetical protein
MGKLERISVWTLIAGIALAASIYSNAEALGIKLPRVVWDNQLTPIATQGYKNSEAILEILEDRLFRKRLERKKYAESGLQIPAVIELEIHELEKRIKKMKKELNL